MPLLLERLKDALMKKQKLNESNAYALATYILEKNGYMKNGKLTAKGIKKQNEK